MSKRNSRKKIPQFVKKYTKNSSIFEDLYSVSRDMDRNFLKLYNHDWRSMANPIFIYAAIAGIYNKTYSKYIDENLDNLTLNFIFLEDADIAILNPMSASLGEKTISISTSPVFFGKPLVGDFWNFEDGKFYMISPLTYWRLRQRLRKILRDQTAVRLQMGLYKITA
jgi:hypothetical protein